MQTLEGLPFVAGHPALDFVNTAEERGHPAAGDVLLTPADLRRWGQRYGLLAPATRLTGGAEGELERARAARELLYAVFLARVRGRPLRPGELARLGELAAEGYAAATLARTGGGEVGWRWSRTSLGTVRHVAVTSAVELLRSEATARLKQCPGDHCGWLFVDRTKRGNRRWCLMSECGQDAKVARRRQSSRRSKLATAASMTMANQQATQTR